MSIFPAGLIIMLRIGPMSDGGLARIPFLKARSVRWGGHLDPPNIYVVVDEADTPLGFFPEDFVACILPLETVGPANA